MYGMDCYFRVSQLLTHTYPVDQALSPAWPSIVEQGTFVKELEAVASKYPYYKYNGIWSRDIQETVCIRQMNSLSFTADEPRSH